LKNYNGDYYDQQYDHKINANHFSGNNLTTSPARWRLSS